MERRRMPAKAGEINAQLLSAGVYGLIMSENDLALGRHIRYGCVMWPVWDGENTLLVLQWEDDNGIHQGEHVAGKDFEFNTEQQEVVDYWLRG